MATRRRQWRPILLLLHRASSFVIHGYIDSAPSFSIHPSIDYTPLFTIHRSIAFNHLLFANPTPSSNFRSAQMCLVQYSILF
ncbi:uncharacterized protein G2W53_015464 [Senna tora]|uniref:Secreted protein n=1 Tax=Senna tora TaxID=362788 RepID=A0A835C852_9FABA|nr:uncharacterized protein G2W53_015464 [Senna tora]